MTPDNLPVLRCHDPEEAVDCGEARRPTAEEAARWPDAVCIALYPPQFAGQPVYRAGPTVARAHTTYDHDGRPIACYGADTWDAGQAEPAAILTLHTHSTGRQT